VWFAKTERMSATRNARLVGRLLKGQIYNNPYMTLGIAKNIGAAIRTAS